MTGNFFGGQFFGGGFFGVGTPGGVGGPKAKAKKKVIRLYDGDRETTADFIKAQLNLRQGFPEPLKEIREKKEKRVIVAQAKREAKMRAEHEKAEAEKAEVLKVNAQILQLIAMTYDA